MDELAEVRQERRPSRLYRLHFATAEFEAQFRGWQRHRHRVTRMSLFLVFAVAVLLTPLFDVALFGADGPARPLLRAIHWQLMLPMTLIAAGAGFLPWSAARRALQTLGAATMWGGVLALRALALHEGFDYPSQIFSLVVVAVALFGGYHWRRVLPGTWLFSALAIWVEWHFATPLSNPAVQTYCLALMSLMATAGAGTLELQSRLIWLSKRQGEVLAATDGLTGLANHYEFHRSLQRVLAQAARDQRTIAVTLLDLDHFKGINDRYGHLFGDRVLREIGALLRGQYARRPLDLRARYGGEEMALVWYDVNPALLPAMLDEVLDAIRALPFADPAGGMRVRVTASAGLCWLVPREDTSAEAVLHQADLLLYRAKSEGRDRGCIAAFQSASAAIVTMPGADADRRAARRAGGEPRS